MKKITFIHPHIANYSASFFNALVDSGYEVTVLADLHTDNTLNQYKNMECRYQVEHLPNKKIGPFFFRPKIRRLINKSSPEIVIYLGNPRDVSQICSMFIDFSLGNKFIVWSMFHRIGGPRLYSEIIYRVFGRISTLNLCYSKTGAISQINRGVSANKVAVLGTAIDERKVMGYAEQTTSEQLNKFKELENLNGKKIILQVVRLSKIKKPELLIEAMNKICQVRNDVIAILIGDGELYSSMELLIEEAGLKDKIRLLGAIYDEAVLAQWFKVADVTVVPTCIGLSVHHAMSYSCIVITDSNYAEQASEFELIIDGFNGLTYDPWVKNSMAKTILDAFNKNDLKRIGSAANDTVLHGFSMKNKVDNFTKSLQRIEGGFNG